MPDPNNANLVEELRSKTEKSDLKQYLKSSLGGYTRKSVLEYLNVLRRQQQAMADTFSLNQQTLFDEKENLKKENESLKARLEQVESEYRSLSNSLRIHSLDTDELTSSDIAALKSTIAALEEDLNQSGVEKSKLENLIAQKDTIIDDCGKKLEQAGKEAAALKEMLKAEAQETKAQRNSAARLAGTIEEKEEEIKFLNSLVTSGQVAELTGKVNELTQQLSLQTEMIAGINNETAAKTETIESLTQQADTLKQSIASLTQTLEALNGQNDKLAFSNKALSDQLEAEYRRSVELIKEKSAISAEKLTAVRKLDEANAKILLLELQLQKKAASAELSGVYRSEDQTVAINTGVS